MSVPKKLAAGILFVLFVSACITVESALYLADAIKGKNK